MPSKDSADARWFAEEVQIHGSTLRTYLQNRFQGLPDVDDIVQESFLRVMRARERGQINSARGLLYATARNLALDHYRRRQAVCIDSIAEIEALSVLDDAAAIPEVVGKTQELALLTQAIQTLPDRCRQVLTLRKIYGLSQKAIAAQLGIAEHTVEAQVGLGVRRCAAFLARHGLP
jgi:RNA polymerase sigma factor (sigma-70 family)